MRLRRLWGSCFSPVNSPTCLWPNLVLLGVERLEIDPGNTAMTPLSFLYYPFSHSLIASLVWAAIFATTYWPTYAHRYQDGNGACRTGFKPLDPGHC